MPSKPPLEPLCWCFTTMTAQGQFELHVDLIAMVGTIATIALMATLPRNPH